MLGLLFFGHGGHELGKDRLERSTALGFVSQRSAGYFKGSGIRCVVNALLQLGIVALVVVGTLGICSFYVGCKSNLSGALNLDGIVGNANRFKHFAFRNLVHFTFDHYYAVAGGSDHHFDVCFLELRWAWVNYKFTVHTGYTHLRDGSFEGHITHRQSGRCSKTGKTVGSDLGVKRQQGDDYLSLCVVVLRKEGAKHAVNQTGHENLAVAWAAFAL